MKTPAFLHPSVVLFLHDEALAAFGGIPGIRDEGLMLSALARPENSLAYSDPGTVDIFDLATSYAFGIASNHPFADANKRTAWSSCVTFLARNGHQLSVSADAVVDMMVALASHRCDEPTFAAWLRTIARPQSPGAVP